MSLSQDLQAMFSLAVEQRPVNFLLSVTAEYLEISVWVLKWRSGTLQPAQAVETKLTWAVFIFLFLHVRYLNSERRKIDYFPSPENEISAEIKKIFWLLQMI